VLTRFDIIYNDDYRAHSLFRNRSSIIDRFRYSDRMDYCRCRRRQSCGRTHANGTVYSVVAGICTSGVTMASMPEPETPLNNRRPTRLEILRADRGTSSADQPRPRSLPSMSRQFVFIHYQWHSRQSEWPRPLTRRSSLRNSCSILT